MRLRSLGNTLFAAFGVAALMSLGVACGGDTKPDVTGAISVTGSGAETASSKPSPSPSGDLGDTKYVPEVVAPGEYRSFVYEGPRPTQFQESPEMAELVKAGKPCGSTIQYDVWKSPTACPPLEERLPHPDDVMVVAPPEAIGVYGGDRRIIGTYPALIHGASTDACMVADFNGQKLAHFCKAVEISEDGRSYIVTFRRGVKWSDGKPITMEDVKFAWEDLDLNREYHPHINPDYKDAVTGNPVKFAVLDDWTFAITYDTPNYTLVEGKFLGTSNCRSWCWYAPKHHLKMYHPKYADPKFLKAELKKSGKTEWTRLFWKMDMHREFHVPFTGPYFVPPNGEKNGYGTDFPWSKGFARIVRNPYYFAVDPSGNQLPYINAVNYQQVESRETAAFRAMAGEVDGPDGRMARLKELPLYHYNMEKGDYSIYRRLNPSGLDSGFILSMDYKLDEELGKLLRTQDFRYAWSYAIDRENINDTIFLGLGVPQNWSPHPGTLFAPEKEWARHEVRFDLPKAKELMAKMGYQDKNGDGYLDRLDGKGNLTLFLEAGASVGLGNIMSGSEHIEVAILVQKYLKDLGIKLNYRLGNDISNAYGEGRQYMQLANDGYSQEPWGPPWTALTPQYEGRSMGPQVATYFFTGGKEGMKPSGPDPKWSDIYGNMSPPGESYPSDISGNMMKLQDIIVEGRGLRRHDPRRIELGKEIFRIHAQEKYVINTVSYSGCCGRVGMVRNNLRNFDLSLGLGYSQAYFFENGVDNMNNPGNRSDLHKSWSFALDQ